MLRLRSKSFLRAESAAEATTDFTKPPTVRSPPRPPTSILYSLTPSTKVSSSSCSVNDKTCFLKFDPQYQFSPQIKFCSTVCEPFLARCFYCYFLFLARCRWWRAGRRGTWGSASTSPTSSSPSSVSSSSFSSLRQDSLAPVCHNLLLSSLSAILSNK